jgi:hypothetical protein
MKNHCEQADLTCLVGLIAIRVSCALHSHSSLVTRSLTLCWTQISVCTPHLWLLTAVDLTRACI